MIKINLLKEEAGKEKGQKKGITSAPKKGAEAAPIGGPAPAGMGILPVIVMLILLFISILGCLGMFMMQTLKIKNLKKTVVLKQQEFEDKSKKQQALKALNERKERINQRINAIQQLNQDRYRSVSILQEINTCLPQQIWLTQLKQSGKSTIEFKGVSITNLTIPDFMARLETSLMFSNVQLIESKRTDVEGKSVREFTIQSTVDQF
ncbi:MAG: PilN domain-containing protein [Candidatus Coatesbacteria bacterium]|nr:PilN domain-containing protein [Candidatus Coatesbacteria bacterium]